MADAVTTWDVLTLTVLACTFLAIAWQARDGETGRAANSTASLAAINGATERLHTVMSIWLERPELRKYFDSRVPLPEDPLERVRVDTLCEMFADALEFGLDLARHLDEFERHADDWELYVEQCLDKSLILGEFITANRGSIPN